MPNKADITLREINLETNITANITTDKTEEESNLLLNIKTAYAKHARTNDGC